MPVKRANVDKSIWECRLGSAIGMSVRISVRCTPETSSITTNCGSFIPEYSAAADPNSKPIAPENHTAAERRKSARRHRVAESLPDQKGLSDAQHRTKRETCEIRRVTSAQEKHSAQYDRAKPTSEPGPGLRR